MYKILSLDGGGAWSIIQLEALREISKKKSAPGTNHDDAIKFLSEFDLIIANSGGSLALASLITFKTFSKAIQEFSEEEVRKQVFSKKWTIKGGIHKWIFGGPRYSSEKKREGLNTILKDKNLKLTEIPTAAMMGYIWV